jgi:hypothetical protein
MSRCSDPSGSICFTRSDNNWDILFCFTSHNKNGAHHVLSSCTKYIVNIARHGYKLCADVQQAPLRSPKQSIMDTWNPVEGGTNLAFRGVPRTGVTCVLLTFLARFFSACTYDRPSTPTPPPPSVIRFRGRPNFLGHWKYKLQFILLWYFLKTTVQFYAKEN